jgi:hypothetical protein
MVDGATTVARHIAAAVSDKKNVGENKAASSVQPQLETAASTGYSDGGCSGVLLDTDLSSTAILPESSAMIPPSPVGCLDDPRSVFRPPPKLACESPRTSKLSGNRWAQSENVSANASVFPFPFPPVQPRLRMRPSHQFTLVRPSLGRSNGQRQFMARSLKRPTPVHGSVAQTANASSWLGRSNGQRQFMDVTERQRLVPRAPAWWGAFHEAANLATRRNLPI